MEGLKCPPVFTISWRNSKYCGSTAIDEFKSNINHSLDPMAAVDAKERVLSIDSGIEGHHIQNNSYMSQKLDGNVL